MCQVPTNGECLGEQMLKLKGMLERWVSELSHCVSDAVGGLGSDQAHSAHSHSRCCWNRSGLPATCQSLDCPVLQHTTCASHEKSGTAACNANAHGQCKKALHPVHPLSGAFMPSSAIQEGMLEPESGCTSRSVPFVAD